jgi:diguanylate cyclase (GGDEF)-like protein
MTQLLQRLDPRRMPVSYGVVAMLVLVYVSWQAFPWEIVSRGLEAELQQLPVPLIAIYGAWRASKSASGSRHMRSAWRWVAFAIAGQTAGTVAQAIYEQVLHEVAYPSIADLLYLSFYPLLLIGILRFPTAQRDRRGAVQLALDCAIVALGGGAVFVYFIISPQLLSATDPLTTVTSVAYPVGDLILLVALGTALLRGARVETRKTLAVMAVAIGLFIVADLIYGYIIIHGTYRAGDPIEAMYVLAFACFAFTALGQRRIERELPPVAAARAGLARTSWFPYVAIAASFGTVLLSVISEPLFPDVAIVFCAAFITLLVLIREVLSRHSVRQGEAQLAHAQALGQLGSWEYDFARDQIERSAEDMRLHGMDKGAAPMTHEEALLMVHPDDRARVERMMHAAVATREPTTYEMRIVRSDGEVRTLLTRVEVETSGDRPIKVRGTHQDITERKQMEGQLQHQADHDPLTGLYNRRRFGDELDRLLLYASRYGRAGMVVMMDIDDFNFINDTRGHAAGDAALKAFAGAIVARVRDTDVVARIGGDEFAMVLPETNEAQSREIVEQIRATVASGGFDPPIRISGGIVRFGGERFSVEDALIAADIALYEAKDAGKNQVCAYRGSAAAAVTWVERVRSALADERLVLYSQPIIEVKSGVVLCEELLVRMISDDGEVIAPNAFLPTAERYGLITEIDRWVTARGLALALAGSHVSINLSVHSIGDERLLQLMRQAITGGMRAENVIFEITETAALTNIHEARAFTESVTALGFAVALDDFGTGFGSFAYLKHLPAQYLKIDMEFVREMLTSATDRAIVSSIAHVAHSLGKRVIAKGVEDDETLRALRESGIDHAQGFFIGRPARVSSAIALEDALKAGVEQDANLDGHGPPALARGDSVICA